MSAREAFSGIATEINKATDILKSQRPLTANHLVLLSEIYYHILELSDRPFEIRRAELALETDNSEAITKFYSVVQRECDSFCTVYSEKQTEWNALCSQDSLYKLVIQEAKNELGFKIQCANNEKNKWNEIYNKYNDITRIYNSMDCRRGQEKEDMAIINRYCDELENLVGHRISLETVNDEHDKAKKILKKKWDDLDELNRSMQRRAADLYEKIEKDIIPVLFYYVSELRDCINSVLPLECCKERRKAGRPRKDNDYYASAGITDFASCFVDNDKYSEVRRHIENSERRISGNEIFYLFNVLQRDNWIKPDIESVQTFADLLIGEFGEKIGIKCGKYVYSEKDKPEYREKWRSLLKLGPDYSKE